MPTYYITCGWLGGTIAGLVKSVWRATVALLVGGKKSSSPTTLTRSSTRPPDSRAGTYYTAACSAAGSSRSVKRATKQKQRPRTTPGQRRVDRKRNREKMLAREAE